MNTSGKSCRYYTTLEEFWNDALGSKISHKDVLLLCKDAFTAGAFAAMWLRDHNIDPFDELQKMVLEQSKSKGPVQ